MSPTLKAVPSVETTDVSPTEVEESFTVVAPSSS